jgi:hypothetical protein
MNSNIRRINLVGFLLIFLALIGPLFALGGFSGSGLILLLAAVILIKGLLISEYFMEARSAPTGWRIMVPIWIVSTLVLLYWVFS